MTEDFLRAYKATIDLWVEDLKAKPLVPPKVNEVSTSLCWQAPASYGVALNHH